MRKLLTNVLDTTMFVAKKRSNRTRTENSVSRSPLPIPKFKIGLTIFLLVSLFIVNARAAREISAITSFTGGGSYFQNAAPANLVLSLTQCGNGSASNYTASLFFNTINSTTGGTFVSSSSNGAGTTTINYTPSTVNIGTLYYYVVLSLPSSTGCGFTTTLTSSTQAVTVSCQSVSASASKTDVTCNGLSNGTATASATGGSGFTYLWSHGPTNAAVNNLAPNTYTCTVTNSCGNSNAANVTITQPNAISVSIIGANQICNGASTTLTASGATSYSWSTGATTASITVSPSSNTTYTVTGTSAGGCSSTSQLVTVNALPTVTISGTSTICSGASTTLTASGAASYVWTGGPSTSAYTISPTSNTTYTVTGTDANGCTNTASQLITVNALPTVSITGTSTICSGASTTLTASGASSYVWTGGPSTAAYTVSPTSNTTYTVTGTGANGCTKAASQLVTVNALPTVSITGTTTICSGASTTLTASGASSYVWTGGPSTAAYTVSPTSNTTYTVTGTAASGCTNTASQLVTVNAVPTVSITGTSTICSGASTTLTASGASSYVWTGGPSTAIYTVSPTTNTTYTVTGTAANGCTKTASQLVTVNALPNVVISGTSTICSGASTTLTASGASSYVWTGGPSTAGYAVTPTSNTTYTVTGTTNGCSNTASQLVAVNALPTVSISGTSIICSGSSTTLTASGASSYNWNTGPSGPTRTISPTNNTTYSVIGTDANGCTGSASQLVTVNALPTVLISGVSTICSGAATTLTASGASSYAWTGGPATAAYSVSPTSNTSYAVTGTNANGCSGSASQLVTVNALPTVLISGVSTICSGASTTLTASGASSYAWTGGPATAAYTVSPISNTSYTVTGTDTNGCSNTASATVTVNPKPIISINGNDSICAGSSTTLIAGGASTYVWTGGPSTAAYNVSPTSNTSYTVTGTDVNGCSNTASQLVAVIPIPTVSAAASPSSIITGQSSTLSASGAVTYLWSNGATTSSQAVSPAVTTTYTVTGFSNGCSNNASVTVTVADSPNGIGDSSIAKTKLQDVFCGATLASTTTTFGADVVANATNYEFEFTDPVTNVVTFKATGNYSSVFNFHSNAPQLEAYGKTFIVRVRAYVGGVWGTFGIACQLSTPPTIPTTKLGSAYCGITLATTTTSFAADAVPSATNYEFEFTDLATNVVTAKTRGSYSTVFNLNMVPQLEVYGKTYSVRVRAHAGSWGSYGAACLLSTPATIPTTKLTSTFCGATLATTTTTFGCEAVASATNYEFEFTNTATNVVITASTGSYSTAFNLHSVPALEVYGKTYNVRVRVYAGVWGAFGTSCQLSTPTTVPTSKLAAAYCGATLATNTSNFTNDAVPSATDYEYEFTDVATNVVTTKTRGSYSTVFNLKMVPQLAVNGKNYSVRIRAFAGSWGAFGAPCQLNTPSGARLANPLTENAEESILQQDNLMTVEEQIVVQVYPNPSNGTFTLQSNRSGKYLLMNELGEVIKFYILNNDNNNMQEIKGLSAGLYFIISNQTDGTVSQKIIVTK